MKLELVVDPEQKSLAARITPNVVVDPSAVKARLRSRRDRRNIRGDYRAKKPKPNNGNKNAAHKKNGNRPRRQKKTVAELDQEMADYFAQGKQQSD